MLTKLSLEYTQLWAKSLMKTNNCNQMEPAREDLKARGPAYQRRLKKDKKQTNKKPKPITTKWGNHTGLEMGNCDPTGANASCLCKQLPASPHPLRSAVCVNQMFSTKNSNKHCV